MAVIARQTLSWPFDRELAFNGEAKRGYANYVLVWVISKNKNGHYLHSFAVRCTQSGRSAYKSALRWRCG